MLAVNSTNDHPTANTVPFPVLFNTWKHHASWVREQVRSVATGGDEAFAQLANQVVVCGTKLMDFYLGDLSPWQLGECAVDVVQRLGITGFAELKSWLEPQGGYAGFVVPADGSRWILRAGAEHGRYLHLHPGRDSPHTIRVPGLTLKSAILTLALAGQTHRDPFDVRTVNEARTRWLGLPPVRELDPDHGLGEVLRLLHNGTKLAIHADATRAATAT